MVEDFLKIADAWEVGGKHGVGPVVASPDSFYLVLNVATFFDINIGGVIGSLFEKKLPEEYLPTVYNDLPASVIDHPEWPVKARDTSTFKVIVIPYSKVQSVKIPWWTALTVETNGVKFYLRGFFVKRATIREFLTQRGLPVK
jgi:hypothetical protein